MISVPAWQREVISVACGLGERELRDMALQIEEDIRALPEVTQAQVEGIRPYEQIPERTLREFGLTSEISNIICRQSLDLSAGSIKPMAEKYIRTEVRLTSRRIMRIW